MSEQIKESALEFDLQQSKKWDITPHQFTCLRLYVSQYKLTKENIISSLAYLFTQYSKPHMEMFQQLASQYLTLRKLHSIETPFDEIECDLKDTIIGLQVKIRGVTQLETFAYSLYTATRQWEKVENSTSANLIRLKHGPEKVIKYNSTKLIPYYFENNDIFILWGLAKKWKEYSAIGGTCKKYNNYTVNEETTVCLKREIFEESKELLSLDQFDDPEDFTVVVDELKWGTIHNHYYFLEWNVNPVTREKIIETFHSQSHDKQLIKKLEQKKINPKDYFELSGLKSIALQSVEMQTLLINTLYDLQVQKEVYLKLDHKFYTILYKRLEPLIKEYPIPDNNNISTDNNRFDHHILAGLWEIVEQKYRKKYYTIGKFINALSQYIHQL